MPYGCRSQIIDFLEGVPVTDRIVVIYKRSGNIRTHLKRWDVNVCTLQSECLQHLILKKRNSMCLWVAEETLIANCV